MSIYADLTAGKVLVTAQDSTVDLIVPNNSVVSFGTVAQIPSGMTSYALEDNIGYDGTNKIEIAYAGNVYYLIDETDILFKETALP
jgi:ABC-type molybdate transport system substrate-binding protein